MCRVTRKFPDVFISILLPPYPAQIQDVMRCNLSLNFSVVPSIILLTVLRDVLEEKPVLVSP
jgi:hypothetical protein